MTFIYLGRIKDFDLGAQTIICHFTFYNELIIYEDPHYVKQMCHNF